MATITYRRTKIYRNGKFVGYKYPNAASRRYYESKYKKKTTNKKKTISTKKKSTTTTTAKKSSSSISSSIWDKIQAALKIDKKARIPTPKAQPNSTTPPPVRFQDSGQGTYTAPAQTFSRKFNLENDLPLAQGSHHPWAQPTSISSMITGLLAESRNSTLDAWQTWAQSKPGQTSASISGSSPYGVNISYSDSSMVSPMGAFGAIAEQQSEFSDDYNYAVGVNQTTSYDPKTYKGERYTKPLSELTSAEIWWLYYNEPAFKQKYSDLKGNISGATNVKWILPKGIVDVDTGLPSSAPYGGTRPYLDPALNAAPGAPAPTPAPSPTNPNNPGGSTMPNAPQPLPGYDTSGGGVVPSDINPEGSGVFGVYNPWARGEGGEYNAFGPSPGYMAQATMESMALANAYFAPQRMELAYELGDMETDMRRLAVNLGRQVDDPVLQAKLYKEAARSVRTLDVQQNTFAFQMAEQRRREEMQNFQYYDQLAQEEYRLRLANRQYYDDLELRRRYYNLQNWNVANTSSTISNLPAASTAPQQQEQDYSNFLNSGTRNYVTNSPYNTNSLYNAGNLLKV